MQGLHVFIDVRIHKDDPVIAGQHLHQLRRQLREENGIDGSAKILQPRIALVEYLLSEAPPQGIDHVIGDTVVGAVDVAISDDK